MSDERDDQELAKNQQDPEHPLSEETPTEARDNLHVDPNSGLAPQPGGAINDPDSYLEGHGHAPDGVSLNDDGSMVGGDQGLGDQDSEPPEYTTEEAVRAKELETQAISRENAQVESNVPDEQGEGGELDEFTVAQSVATHAGAEQGPVTAAQLGGLQEDVNPMDVQAARDDASADSADDSSDSQVDDSSDQSGDDNAYQAGSSSSDSGSDSDSSKSQPQNSAAQSGGGSVSKSAAKKSAAKKSSSGK